MPLNDVGANSNVELADTNNAAPPPSPPYSAFTPSRKILIITMATIAAGFSGFASNIYFPAIPTIATALGASVEAINLTVTSYMVFQGITPTIWGALSDGFGRRLTLLLTLTIFLGACVGLALTRKFYQLLILRCLQSTGSASTIAIGAGMIGDITTREERGGVMGVFQAGLLMPLALGPVLGGIFAQTLGWRAIFWFLTIWAGSFLILLLLLLPETLRSVVGDGSISPPAWSRPLLLPPPSNKMSKTLRLPVKIDFLAPIRILLLPEVFITLLFLSIHYATWQLSVTAQSSLFSKVYGVSELQIGLTFLANGFGCMLGTLTTGKFLDKDYTRFKERYSGPEDDFPIERARLRSIWVWAPLEWFSVLLFGWTLDKELHISAPIIASFVMAWAAMSTQSIINTYVVDIFPKSSASATAALNMARCLVGAGATASVEPTIKKIGEGWTMTMWTGFMAASSALVGVQMKYGPIWRRKREQKERARAEG